MSTTQLNVPASLLDKATKLSKKGFRVFPLHQPVSPGVCSCRLAQDCDSIGKHPRIKNGLKGATTDEKKIRDWWTRWPDANIGIATGGGMFVLDIDYDNDGDTSLKNLEVKHQDLSDNHPRVLTGNGIHYYFKTTVPVRNSASKIAQGIDIRGDGGYVVAAGSTHSSGAMYDHDVGSGNKLDLPPDWLMSLIEQARGATVQPTAGSADFVVQGGRNDFLIREAGSMRHRGHDEDMIFACLFQMNQKKCKPPLSEAEVRTVAKSAATYAPAAGATPTSWARELKVDRQGNPKKVPGNAVLYLSKHPDWKGVLGFNEMRQRVVWLKSAPGDYGIAKPSVGEQLADWHTAHIQHWLDKNFGLSYSHEVLLRCVVSAAQVNPFHPVREYLDSLQWDGVYRLEKWLSTYMGADDNPYNNLIGRCWLISAVARVMKPGCQADHVLVLESPQGRGKSTGMATLFGHGSDWYMESLPDLTATGSKDAMAALAGPWCLEIAELDAIRGKASTKTKDFLSRRVDEYRPSYGRCYVRYPRQCVFVGTTNQKAWLTDPTGGRRFWPCKVRTIDREAIERDRDQIWAEAYSHYVDGAPWWPSDEFTGILEKEQESRFDVDAWEDILSRYSGTRNEIDVEELYTIGLSIEKGRLSRSDQTRVGNIMGRLGFKKSRPYVKGIRKTIYKREQD